MGYTKDDELAINTIRLLAVRSRLTPVLPTLSTPAFFMPLQ